jgi:hypothetical protein
MIKVGFRNLMGPFLESQVGRVIIASAMAGGTLLTEVAEGLARKKNHGGGNRKAHDRRDERRDKDDHDKDRGHDGRRGERRDKDNHDNRDRDRDHDGRDGNNHRNRGGNDKQDKHDAHEDSSGGNNVGVSAGPVTPEAPVDGDDKLPELRQRRDFGFLS